MKINCHEKYEEIAKVVKIQKSGFRKNSSLS
jgi:hypothetical protein